MKIKDTTAIKIFKALGFQTADNWDLNRLQQKMNKLADLITEDIEIEDEKLMEVVDRILDSIENGKGIIVAKKNKDSKKKNKAKKSTKPAADKDAPKKKKKGGKKKAADATTGKKKKKGGKKKAADTTKAKTTTKKIGVIASIIEIIENHGPISKAGIVKRLAKRFTDRDADKMAKTVAVQVPSRLRSDKGIEVCVEDGKYFIE